MTCYLTTLSQCWSDLCRYMASVGHGVLISPTWTINQYPIPLVFAGESHSGIYCNGNPDKKVRFTFLITWLNIRRHGTKLVTIYTFSSHGRVAHRLIGVLWRKLTVRYRGFVTDIKVIINLWLRQWVVTGNDINGNSRHHCRHYHCFSCCYCCYCHYHHHQHRSRQLQLTYLISTL